MILDGKVISVTICCVGVSGLFLYFGLPWLYSRWNRTRLRQRVVRRNCIVLTLDDGPGQRLTPTILDLLAARNAKATFFLLGRNIPGNEDIVRRIHAEGHEIGSHTWGHLHAWKVAPWRSVSDVRRGMKAIDRALGMQGGKYPFRPAYGKLNLATWLYLLARGIPIVYWTWDSGDTRGMERGTIDGMAGDIGMAGGGVVLVHDYERRSDSARQYVLDVLRATLNTAQERGFQLLTWSRLMETGT